jgi:threonine aldolase
MTGIPESEYAKTFDSVSVCFSKGLGAPVGSALVGSMELAERARRFRKQFGGGMRQAGIVAAGALYALLHHRERLSDDHANAKRLANGLSEIPGISVNSDTVATNMVYFDVEHRPAMELTGRLKELNVLVLPTGEYTIRAVTSLSVETGDISRAVDAVRKIMSAPSE